MFWFLRAPQVIEAYYCEYFALTVVNAVLMQKENNFFSIIKKKKQNVLSWFYSYLNKKQPKGYLACNLEPPIGIVAYY